jgi:hypothetical protein
MQPDTTQSAGASPTRSVSQWERAVLAQWFAGTERTGEQAVAAAYVSERSRDDPRLRNMIIVAELDQTDIGFLVPRPVGENAWTLTCGRTGADLGRFRTLPEALNTIRSHRNDPDAQIATAPLRVEDTLADVSHDR